MKKVICLVLCLTLLGTMIFLSGCTTAADKVNAQLNKEADEFRLLRRVTVYNTVTNDILYVVEGYLSLSNNQSNELVITVKVGENSYRKHYLYLRSNYISYIMEDTYENKYVEEYPHCVYWNLKTENEDLEWLNDVNHWTK